MRTESEGGARYFVTFIDDHTRWCEVYLIGFLKELKLGTLTNVTIFNDNQGAGELARNPVYHGRSKHIDVRYHFIREALANQSMKLEYKPTEQMPADVLTKALANGKHEFCVRSLGLMGICVEEEHQN
ncbi:Retrovirus-related Pol polyprotein from transposon TNT 1-94 [Formica fusca]